MNFDRTPRKRPDVTSPGLEIDDHGGRFVTRRSSAAQFTASVVVPVPPFVPRNDTTMPWVEAMGMPRRPAGGMTCCDGSLRTDATASPWHAAARPFQSVMGATISVQFDVGAGRRFAAPRLGDWPAFTGGTPCSPGARSLLGAMWSPSPAWPRSVRSRPRPRPPTSGASTTPRKRACRRCTRASGVRSSGRLRHRQRRERRRAGRPDRTADGVGMAIQEARRRAELLAKANAAAAATAGAGATPPRRPRRRRPLRWHERRAPRAPKATSADRSARRSPPPAARQCRQSRVRQPLRRPPLAASRRSPRLAGDRRHVGRRRRGRRRVRRTAATPFPRRPAPAVPPPSPRRPRGPVPLAAWAHAVSDSPRPEPKRAEGKGLWRGIFTIPSEVALVEYGRGCRIHRLVIETAPEAISDPF